MLAQLSKLIDTYFNALNANDTNTALECFSDEATVLDEGETMIGKKSIREWIEKSKSKYNPKFKALSMKENKNDSIVNTEISGTFEGSPIKLDYHFKIKNNLIENLRILIPSKD